jgi:hypothetical protein
VPLSRSPGGLLIARRHAWRVRQTGEIERLRAALTDAGVAGAGDFGRFVNHTRRSRPSAFDARAATPVLMRMLPSLADPHAVEAVATHLADRLVPARSACPDHCIPAVGAGAPPWRWAATRQHHRGSRRQ